jgi:GLPGLI family protein
MKMNNWCILFSLVFSQAFGQQMVFQGKITYLRQENLHRQFDDEGNSSWVKEVKKQTPKHRNDEFELYFNNKRALYKLSKEEENQAAARGWWRVAWDNLVFWDVAANRLYQEKSIYEEQYRIVDSLPFYTWKMDGELREIAGYTCRRATTILYDSLYVIAYFTEQIPVSYGPETFGGLPGMILGVVLPRLNYTFFATKVEPMTIGDKETTFTQRKKYRELNKTAMMKEINDAVKNWGNYGRKIYWKCVF